MLALSFPEYIFNRKIPCYFIDFDRALELDFFRYLLKLNSYDSFSIHFSFEKTTPAKILSCESITFDSSEDQYKILADSICDPDGLYLRSSCIMFSSSNNSWNVWCERDFELGVLGTDSKLEKGDIYKNLHEPDIFLNDMISSEIYSKEFKKNIIKIRDNYS